MVLDEPFAGLDAITRRKMQLWLKDICKNYQPSVLFVTHDIDEALMLADSIYVFSSRPARVMLNLKKTTPNDSERFKKEILSVLEIDENQANV
jgi:ABC-type nitrate/sulfonate/bicarbonate transport system ATPase subunit